LRLEQQRLARRGHVHELSRPFGEIVEAVRKPSPTPITEAGRISFRTARS
jgi:hypothetical protein